MVVIIAVLLSFVRLSVGITGPREDLVQATERLAESLRLAEQEAVLHGRRYGLTASATDYGYLVARGDAWQPLDDALLGRRELPSGITLTLRQDGRTQGLATAAVRDRPVLQFTPDGIAAPYRIELRAGSGEAMTIENGIDRRGWRVIGWPGSR